jgi:proliferating cell nuclear antigen
MISVTIHDHHRLEIIVALFSLLKQWGSSITMNFSKSELNIQTMDKSHICLANIKISSEWFTSFNIINDCVLSVDTAMFALIMNHASKYPKLELNSTNLDKLNVHCFGENKSNIFEHFFEIPTIDIEKDELGVVDMDYDVDLIISSRKLFDILSELNEFGQNVTIKCSENEIVLSSKDTASLEIKINPENIVEYSISEDTNVETSFSLNHLFKMCTTSKLSENIKLGLSDEVPIRLEYDLGINSSVSFFLAPKVLNDD